MSFRHMHQDLQSERLLLVVLEDPQYGGSEYRHIRATVIRRAVAHTYKDDQPSVVAQWGDDAPSKCFGYRVASYCFPTKQNGIFVDDMQLRGQIDAKCSSPLNSGRPYGTDVRFTPYSVCQNTARAISDFYTKRDKYFEKMGFARQDEEFYVALCHLAQFLKITKCVFQSPNVRHTSLSEINNFIETDLAGASVHVERLLAPFIRLE